MLWKSQVLHTVSCNISSGGAAGKLINRARVNSGNDVSQRYHCFTQTVNGREQQYLIMPQRYWTCSADTHTHTSLYYLCAYTTDSDCLYALWLRLTQSAQWPSVSLSKIKTNNENALPSFTRCRCPGGNQRHGWKVILFCLGPRRRARGLPRFLFGELWYTSSSAPEIWAFVLETTHREVQSKVFFCTG